MGCSCDSCRSGKACCGADPCAAISAEILDIDRMETALNRELATAQAIRRTSRKLAALTGEYAPQAEDANETNVRAALRRLGEKRQALVRRACALCPDSNYCR
jgi:hypothetical protein